MPTGLQIPLFRVQVCYHPAMKDFQGFSNSFREIFTCLNNSDTTKIHRRESQACSGDTEPFTYCFLCHYSSYCSSHLTHPTLREEKYSEITGSPWTPMWAHPCLNWDFSYTTFSSHPITAECKGQQGKTKYIQSFLASRNQRQDVRERKRGIFPHSSNLTKVLPDSHSVFTSCQIHLTLCDCYKRY